MRYFSRGPGFLQFVWGCRGFLWVLTANPIKLETGLRPNSAGIPYTLLLRIEAIGFPIFLASTVGYSDFRVLGLV